MAKFFQYDTGASERVWILIDDISLIKMEGNGRVMVTMKSDPSGKPVPLSSENGARLLELLVAQGYIGEN